MQDTCVHRAGSTQQDAVDGSQSARRKTLRVREHSPSRGRIALKTRKLSQRAEEAQCRPPQACSDAREVMVVEEERSAYAPDGQRQGVWLRLSELSDTVRHVLAGTAARTMAQAIIHPIDTIKTRLQVQVPTPRLQEWTRRVLEQPVVMPVGRGRWQAKNWLVMGPRDVYLGLTGAVLGTIPTALVYFAAYEWAKARMEARNWSSSAVHLASAGLGAMCSACVRVPADTLKHRVQAYLHPNVFSAAHSVWSSTGCRGLYRGFMPTLLRDVPEIAIQFAVYDRLRRCVQQRREVSKLQTWEHLLLGGVSGALAAAATCPLDVVKTSLQCGTGLPMRQVVADTLRERGATGLFAGMGPRVSQTAIMSAAFFALFECCKLHLKPQRSPSDRLLTPKILHKRRSKVLKRQFVYQ